MAEEVATTRPNEVAQPTQPNSYDARQILDRVGEVHNKVMDGVLGLSTKELVGDAKTLDAVASMMSGIAGTAVQVIKAGQEANAENVGMIADAVIDRMKANGVSLINVHEGEYSEVDSRAAPNIRIELDEGQVIEPDMLRKGLVNRTYADFAGQHDLYNPDAED